MTEEAQRSSRTQLLGGVPQRTGISQSRPRGLGALEMVPSFIPTSSPSWIQGRRIWMSSPGCVGEP